MEFSITFGGRNGIYNPNSAPSTLPPQLRGHQHITSIPGMASELNHPMDEEDEGDAFSSSTLWDFSTPPSFGQPITRGLSIAEIFDLRMLEIRGKKSALIHGKLEVVTGGGPIYIFNQPDMTYAQRISAKELIPIKGPWRAVSGNGDVLLDISLKEGGKELIEDAIGFSFIRDKENTVVTKRSIGRCGSLEMRLAVYTFAVVASIEIKLISSQNGREKSGLYGRITASNTMLPRMESILFCKKRGEHVEVANGDLIPLCRSVTAVPFKHHLKIHAHLYDVSGGHLVIGDALYFPERFCNVIEYINGRWGQKIQVTVTWEDFWDHVKRVGAYAPFFGGTYGSYQTQRLRERARIL